MNLKNLSKIDIAILIAIIFHTVGFVGMRFFNKEYFAALTPMNLLLSFALLVWTSDFKNKAFWIFVITCFVVGIAVEIVGVNTAVLFGHYSYGTTLGPKVAKVPWLIGLNWFIVLYCSATFMHHAFERLKAYATIDNNSKWRSLSMVLDTATIAVALDWIIEPVAIDLGYWQWQNNEIPTYNYICWFGVSALLALVYRYLNFQKRNKFAIHLLLIQVLFFLTLRANL